MLMRVREMVGRLSPVQVVTMGYAFYAVCIAGLLCIPFMWAGERVGVLDNLFMAVSAVSTTGLVTVNTPDAYGFWGELVLLVGIQVGGLGYMTFGSFMIMATRRAMDESRVRIGRVVFAMPDDFDTGDFIRQAVAFTLGLEVLGALGLWVAFSQAGVESPLWPAIFHSVSAFCTAGFSVFPDSLEGFRGDVAVNAIVSILSLAGACGFIVSSDLWLKLRRGRRMTLTTRIILTATGGGLVLGAVVIFFDPLMRELPLGERGMASFFQSMSALTTVGFNSVPIGNLAGAAILMTVILMILGASPSGTGGGLKSTTWSAGLAATWSAVRGRKEITFFGSRLPTHRLQAAFAAMTMYLLVFAGGAIAMLLVDTQHTFENVVFEVGSALGTVGLSRGITGDLSAAGKCVLITLMFVGRVGVVSLGLAAMGRAGAPGAEVGPEEDLVV